MKSSPHLAVHALIAGWLGLTVYLFLVSEPRPIGWAIVGPMGVAVAYFAAQWIRSRRASRRESGDPVNLGNQDPLG